MQHSLVELCDGLLCYLILHIPVSVCTCKERKKKKYQNPALLLLKGSQDCIPAPELCFKYVYPSLVFCIKKNHKEKEPFIVQHVGIVSPLLFFSFLEYIKQLILLYLLFSFVNFLVLFKNGFIKGLL